jgi:hypothetical protein
VRRQQPARESFGSGSIRSTRGGGGGDGGGSGGDGGYLIPPDFRQDIISKIFEPFFTTKEIGKGTGLGLPLARKVALRAGGELMLSSQPGKGTTVVLELPAIHRPAQHRPGQSTQPRKAMVSVRNERAAALIGQILLGAGFNLLTPNKRGPGTADLWITDPTPNSLLVATRWQRRRVTAAIAVLGEPSSRSRRNWAALGATVLHAGDDIQSIRRALGEALARM